MLVILPLYPLADLPPTTGTRPGRSFTAQTRSENGLTLFGQAESEDVTNTTRIPNRPIAATEIPPHEWASSLFSIGSGDYALRLYRVNNVGRLARHNVTFQPLLPHAHNDNLMVMRVNKAVITAAAPNQNTIPLQRLVNRDGCETTALQLIIEETLSAGIEEICVVIRPGDSAAYEVAAGEHLSLVDFVEQPEPLGYADAIYRAKDFIDGNPFLHLVGDHLHISGIEQRCAEQLVKVASEFECSVSAVQPTRENKLPYFGIVAGTNVPRYDGLYEISRVIEKPTPTLAEQELITAGLRSGHYLGFFGMHVLTAGAFDSIVQVMDSVAKNDLSLTSRPSLSDALALLPARQRYLAYRIKGSRYNIGIQYGLLMAQLAISLSGRDRDQILTELLELVASRPGSGDDFSDSHAVSEVDSPASRKASR